LNDDGRFTGYAGALATAILFTLSKLNLSRLLLKMICVGAVGQWMCMIHFVAGKIISQLTGLPFIF